MSDSIATPDDPYLHELPYTELTAELREVSCGALSVVVDFNDLLSDRGDEAYEIVAKLKDLLA
jgi:hypothetical protein